MPTSFRFANGVRAHYANGNFLKYTEYAWELYTNDPAKGGKWVASIPVRLAGILETAIAEVHMVELSKDLTERKAVELVLYNLEILRRYGNGYLLQDLKAYLE